MRAAALVWIGIILGLMPLQAIWSRHKVQKLRPTPMQAYASTAAGLTLVGTVTFLIDWFSGRIGLRAVRTLVPAERLMVWTAATWAACAVIWFGGMLQRKIWRHAVDEVIAALLPRTRRERLAFLGIALLAGTVEEFVMRGFSLLFLERATGSAFIAFVLVTFGFALAHGYQGPWATLRTGLLGTILAVPVLATGALLPSMVAHTATDVLAGACGYTLLRRWRLID